MKEEWKHPHIQPFSENAILISWENIISEDLLYFMLQVRKQIIQKFRTASVSVVNSYNAILIKYKEATNDRNIEIEKIKEIITSISPEAKRKLSKYRLPVCYDKVYGIDLDLVAKTRNLTTNEVVGLHTSATYTIYFIGFLPGFLYLGGLDERLKISRKKEPRLKVEKGSVGLAENQTGVYPQSSPGGWQIIGNCPVNFFNPFQSPPSPFNAGDKLTFFEVTESEFQLIKKDIAHQTFKLEKTDYLS